MTEFTGERVIPGQVEDDLWAEHLARYAFAARLAAGKRVLDVGCGVGYGAAELALTAREVTGVDVSAEAVDYAAENYARPRFLTASAENLPFEAGSFDLVTAFELIEHLDNWRGMLAEARRVLHPAGVLVVSTPNKLYYAESRGAAGPNPYHRHEFEYAEFCAALATFFPQVRVLLQDRMESFGFYEPAGAEKAEGSIVRSPGAAAGANFFIGVCSGQALPEESGFVYVPRAANLLREREAHISKLTSELGQVRTWLEGATAERDGILLKYAQLEEHLKEKNRWAVELDATLKAAQERIVELQEQIAAEQASAAAIIEQLEQAQVRIVDLQEQYGAEQSRAVAILKQMEQAQARIMELQEQYGAEQARAREAIAGLNAALSEEQAHARKAIAGLNVALSEEQARALKNITRLEATVVERTQWAQDLDAQVHKLRGELKVLTTQAAELTGTLALIRQSRWVKAGRTVGLGPKLPE